MAIDDSKPVNNNLWFPNDDTSINHADKVVSEATAKKKAEDDRIAALVAEAVKTAVATEKSAASIEKEKVIKEKDGVTQEKNTLAEQKKSIEGERDKMIGERDAANAQLEKYKKQSLLYEPENNLDVSWHGVLVLIYNLNDKKAVDMACPGQTGPTERAWSMNMEHWNINQQFMLEKQGGTSAATATSDLWLLKCRQNAQAKDRLWCLETKTQEMFNVRAANRDASVGDRQYWQISSLPFRNMNGGVFRLKNWATKEYLTQEDLNENKNGKLLRTLPAMDGENQWKQQWAFWRIQPGPV